MRRWQLATAAVREGAAEASQPIVARRKPAGRVRDRRRQRSSGSTTFRSRFDPARRSASWASRARASPSPSLSLMRLVEFGGGRIAAGRLVFAPRDRRARSTLPKADAASSCASCAAAEIGMIFQEPMTSLNPVFTIERQLVDGLEAHHGSAPGEGAGAGARAACKAFAFPSLNVASSNIRTSFPAACASAS